MGTVSSGLATISSRGGVPIHPKIGVPVHLGKRSATSTTVEKPAVVLLQGTRGYRFIRHEGDHGASGVPIHRVGKVFAAFENANIRVREVSPEPRGPEGYRFIGRFWSDYGRLFGIALGTAVLHGWILKPPVTLSTFSCGYTACTFFRVVRSFFLKFLGSA